MGDVSRNYSTIDCGRLTKTVAYTSQHIEWEDSVAKLGHFTIFSGNDPFTQPQTKLVWVSTDIPGIKQPVHKVRYYKNTVRVVVEGPDGNEAKKQFTACAQQAAIRGLIVGLVTAYATSGTAGVSAGLATFASQLDACIEKGLAKAVEITASVENDGGWGPWQ